MDPTLDPARVPTGSAAVCLGCAYPLSGLDPAASCPECGRPVALSRPVPDLTNFPNALPAVDPAALESLPVIDGMWPCQRCGYGLHNLRIDAFCPACGFPVAASVPDRAGYQTPRGVKCRSCAYELGGLDRRGHCPECNFSIARSLRGDLLLDSPAGHVKRLLLGARLIFWASLLPLVTAGLFLVTLFVAAGGSAVAGDVLAVLALVAVLATYVCFFTGWILLTDRDRGMFTPTIETMRVATRIGVIVMGVFIGGSFLLSFLSRYTFFVGSSTGNFTGGATFGILLFLIQGAALLTIPIGLTAMILSMIYLRRWSQRLPDRFIFQRARFMMWAWPGLFVLNLVLVCGGFALMLGTLSGGMGGGVGATVLFLLPYLFFLGTSLAFLILYAHLFSRVARALRTVRAAQRALPAPAPLKPTA